LERKQIQQAIHQIEKLESKGVDEALVKLNVDGAPALFKKGKQSVDEVVDLDLSDTYRPPTTRFGW